MRTLVAVMASMWVFTCSGGPAPGLDAGTAGGGTTGSGGGAAAGGSGTAGGSTAGGGTAGGGATAGGTGTAGGGATAGGSGTAGGTGGAGGGAICSPACPQSRDCCGGRCVNTANDPLNCGACGTRCEGANGFCNGGVCMPPQCNQDAGACGIGTTCCGRSCCRADEYCCSVEGSVAGLPPVCHPKDGGTCPQGCAPLCSSDRGLKRDVVQELSSMHFVVEAGHLRPSAEPVDVHGTTLAAIQALYAGLKEQQARLTALEAENARLRLHLLAEERGTCGPAAPDPGPACADDSRHGPWGDRAGDLRGVCAP